MKRILTRRQPDHSSASGHVGVGSRSVDTESDILLYYSFVEQVLQRGAIDAADRFLAPNFVEHGAGGDSRRSEFVQRLTRQFADRPDAIWTIELLVSVGTLVLCHSTISTGNGGLPRAALDAWESVVVRFTGGKIAEIWRVYNDVQATAPSS